MEAVNATARNRSEAGDRRPRVWLGLAALLLGLALTAVAGADVLIMKDGRELRGKVRAEGDFLVVEGQYGDLRVPRDKVASWVRSETAAEVFERKAKTVLKSGSADERYRLGVEARREGLLTAARKAFQATIDADPDHPGARAALGYRQFQGRWVLEDDWHRLQGHVPYDGRWVTPAEKAKLVKEAFEREQRERLEDARRRAQKGIDQALRGGRARRSSPGRSSSPAPRRDGFDWYRDRQLFQSYFGISSPWIVNGFGRYLNGTIFRLPLVQVLPGGLALSNRDLLTYVGARQRGIPVPSYLTSPWVAVRTNPVIFGATGRGGPRARFPGSGFSLVYRGDDFSIGVSGGAWRGRNGSGYGFGPSWVYRRGNFQASFGPGSRGRRSGGRGRGSYGGRVGRRSGSAGRGSSAGRSGGYTPPTVQNPYPGRSAQPAGPPAPSGGGYRAPRLGRP